MVVAFLNPEELLVASFVSIGHLLKMFRRDSNLEKLSFYEPGRLYSLRFSKDGLSAQRTFKRKLTTALGKLSFLASIPSTNSL